MKDELNENQKNAIEIIAMMVVGFKLTKDEAISELTKMAHLILSNEPNAVAPQESVREILTEVLNSLPEYAGCDELICSIIDEYLKDSPEAEKVSDEDICEYFPIGANADQKWIKKQIYRREGAKAMRDGLIKT
jgi:hypothetical protein